MNIDDRVKIKPFKAWLDLDKNEVEDNKPSIYVRSMYKFIGDIGKITKFMTHGKYKLYTVVLKTSMGYEEHIFFEEDLEYIKELSLIKYIKLLLSKFL
jgi:hypothetical protein